MRLTVALVAIVAAAFSPHTATAAEGGAGHDLPGFMGPQAGLKPPPGGYLATDGLEGSSSEFLPCSDRIAQDVDARIFGALAVAHPAPAEGLLDRLRVQARREAGRDQRALAPRDRREEPSRGRPGIVVTTLEL